MALFQCLDKKNKVLQNWTQIHVRGNEMILFKSVDEMLFCFYVKCNVVCVTVALKDKSQDCTLLLEVLQKVNE